MYVRSFWANTMTHWLWLHEVKRGGKKTGMSIVIPWKKSSGIWVFRAQNKGHKHNKKRMGSLLWTKRGLSWLLGLTPASHSVLPNASALRTIHQRLPHKDRLLYCFHLSHQKHNHTSGSSRNPGEMLMFDDRSNHKWDASAVRLNRGNKVFMKSYFVSTIQCISGQNRN